MTYSGSTNNSSYSKRVYNKKDSNDLAEYAKALESQRKQTVKEFKAASTDQLGELDRQDSIQTSNDKFQLQQLSKFSDTLNDFLDTAAKTVGKGYIDAKRQQGVELYRRYEAGDPDAIAEVEGNIQQIEEINEKVNSMSKNINESTEAFLDRQNQENISLRDKLKALNVRKMGANVRWGFVRAQLQEAAQGYKAHLIDELKNNEGTFITKDKTEYKINDYYTILNSDHKEEIENYIEDQYIANNNPFGAADVVRNSYLTSSVVKATAEFRNAEFKQELARQGETEQSDRINKLITAAENFGPEVELVDGKYVDVKLLAVVNSIDDLLINGPGSEALIGSTVSRFKANKTRLIEGIKSALSALDPDTASEYVEFLKGYTGFEMAGMTGDLETLMAGDLDLDQLLIDHNNKTRLNQDKIDESLKAEVTLEVKKATSLYTDNVINETTGLPHTKGDIREIGLRMLSEERYDSDELRPIIQKLVFFDPPELNNKESRNKYNELVAKNGYVTHEDLLGLDAQFRIDILDDAKKNGGRYKYKPNHIWSDMGKENWSKLIDKELKDSGINETVTSKIKTSLTENGDGVKINAALDGTRAYITKLIGANYLNGDTPEVALQKAIAQAAGEATAGQGIFATDAEGFTSQLMNPVVLAKNEQIGSILADGTAARNKLDVLQQYAPDGDHIRNEIIIPKNSTLLTPKYDEGTNKISKLPRALMQIAEFSETGYTAIDVLNLQRLKHGEDEIPLSDFSPELQALHTAVKDKYKHLAKVFSSDAEGFSRAIDELGAVDLNTLTNSIVVNIESPIYEGDLDLVLAREGIEVSEYENDALVREKVHRLQVNHLLKQAVSQTNDKNQAILMVATGMRFGEGSMNDYGEGSIYDNVDNDKADYAFDVLDGYYSGDTSKLLGKYNKDSLSVSNSRDLTKFEEKYNLEPNIVLENLLDIDETSGVNFKDFDRNTSIYKLLLEMEPPKEIEVAGTFGIGKTFKHNPLWDKWNNKTRKWANLNRVNQKILNGTAISPITDRVDYNNLVNMLIAQEKYDGNKDIAYQDSPIFQWRDEWNEQNADRLENATKKNIDKLRRQRDIYIMTNLRKYLGLDS
jgi:DNA-directed RNA polymerase subunit F